MSTTTLQDPVRVGAAVQARRGYLGLSQDDVVARSRRGISKPVLSILENGRQQSYRTRTLQSVRTALGWPIDWVERVESGEDLTHFAHPTVDPAPEERRSHAADAGVSQLRSELADLVETVGRLREQVAELADSSAQVAELTGERIDALERQLRVRTAQ